MALILDTDRLARLFPAYVRLDREGVIRGVGPSLQRHCAQPLEGLGFFDAFVLERPRSIHGIDALIGHERVVIAHHRDMAMLRLRGSVQQQDDDVFLLFGHIPAMEEQDASAPRLRVADFSPSDGSFDILLAAHMRKALLDDTTKLAVKLRAKTREAESANEAKSQFLACMSHEIRTPMNGVLAMAYALAKTPLTDKQREMLNVINASGESLMRIINDVLDLSKIEAGKCELETTAFDLADLVASVEALYAIKADEKGLKLHIAIGDDATGVYVGDPTRIKQVLANLVSNAIKFTEHGAVLVTVSAKPLDEPGRCALHFVVADSGPGIAADAIDRLFQSFTQADASTTRRYGGTGLGLSISRQLSRLMGGDIRVESALGQGSVFRFHVPVDVEADASVVDDNAADAETAEASAREHGRMRILVAEDNPQNQVVLSTLLEPLDAEVVMTINGRDAVEAWTNAEFDLVLMDIQMPVMNGVDACASIRCLEREHGRARTPILAVSANVMPHQVAEYLDVGMNGHVAKPIQPALLFSKISEAMSSAPDEAERPEDAIAG